MYRKHSNDVVRQVEIPGKSTIFVARQIYLVVWYNFQVASEVTEKEISAYKVTVKHLDIDLFPMSSCIATAWLVHDGGNIQKP